LFVVVLERGISEDEGRGTRDEDEKYNINSTVLPPYRE
jgi:hypothetical protein